MDWISWAAVISGLAVFFSVLVKVIGFPDQIRLNYNRQSTEGLSVWSFVTGFFAYLFLTMHGIIQNDWVVIVTQGLGAVLFAVILLQFYIYD